MRRYCILILLLNLCAYTPAMADIWQAAPQHKPTNNEKKQYIASKTYKTDVAALRQALHTANKGTARTIELPMPDGTLKTFAVWPTELLPAELAARYPQIATYNATAVGEPGVTAKLDFTEYGFHAMVYAGANTALIDPEDNENTGYYTVYYKRDIAKQNVAHSCATVHNDVDELASQLKGIAANKTVGGHFIRRYRMALSCSHQYAQAVTGIATPSKAQVLSKMTTSMNRVNGIYEQETAVTMQFVTKEDTLIYTVAAGDPFGGINNSANALLDKNQEICDTLIGDANYDIGHVFSTGGGGLAQVGATCRTGWKAQGVTGSDIPYGDGFDIDFVAHEIGHEFGADHSFNNNTSGVCRGNAVATAAFEPGSGSSIMAYAGLCEPDNLQKNSDFYFHAYSVQQVYNYIAVYGGCATKIPTGYMAPGVEPFTTSYTIPSRTPFELVAPTAVDSSGTSTVMYCWEQWNLGDFGKTLQQTQKGGPMFRTYTPMATPVRVFPKMEMVLKGVLSNAGVNNASGEKIPDSTRILTFKLSLRTAHPMGGCFNMPDDSVLIHAHSTGVGFTVTSQNVTGIEYTGYSQQEVTWNVAGSDKAPINTSKVDIYLSVDGGYSWPTFLGTFPNTGKAMVSMPNPDTTVNFARLKVKGNNNVFFNVNSKDFRITHNYEAGIRIYPVPAHNYLHVDAENAGLLEAVVINGIGQQVWRGTILDEADLPAYLWGRGAYILKLINPSKMQIIRKFSVY